MKIAGVDEVGVGCLAGDPEADDDGGFGPAIALEMMVKRRHQENPLAGQLEGADLKDDRQRLDDEQPAGDGKHKFVPRRHLEIFNLIPSTLSLGSKYDPHSHVAIATCIFVCCAEIAIISLPLQATGLT